MAAPSADGSSFAEHGGQRAGHGTRGVFAENRQVGPLPTMETSILRS